MMLQNRLRAIIRETARGKSYQDRSINNGVKVFLFDMKKLLSTEIIEEMSDDMLLNNYFGWESIALKYREPDERMKKLKQAISVMVIFENVIETQEPDSKIVNFFKQHKH